MNKANVGLVAGLAVTASSVGYMVVVKAEEISERLERFVNPERSPTVSEQPKCAPQTDCLLGVGGKIMLPEIQNYTSVSCARPARGVVVTINNVPQFQCNL